MHAFLVLVGVDMNSPWIVARRCRNRTSQSGERQMTQRGIWSSCAPTDLKFASIRLTVSTRRIGRGSHTSHVCASRPACSEPDNSAFAEQRSVQVCSELQTVIANGGMPTSRNSCKSMSVYFETPMHQPTESCKNQRALPELFHGRKLL